MKNTAKKILALVFAVAMICTLAVPAFAADEKVEGVVITIVAPTQSGETFQYLAASSYDGEERALDVDEGDTLHDVLKAQAALDYSRSTKTVKGLAAENAVDMVEAGAKGKWVVAVNGAIVEDYEEYTIQEDDSIVVYWYDEVMDTKLFLMDCEQLLSGVISFYYIDAEGNRQPVVDFDVRLRRDDARTDIVNKLTDDVTVNRYKSYYTTDDKGQIWIDPETLADLDATGDYIWISSAKTNEYGIVGDVNYPYPVYGVAVSSDEYDEDVAEYYEKFGGCHRISTLVVDESVELSDVKGTAYDAPNTGDITMVYVLVAAVAIVTLGAVVVMKKKAVKAN